MKKHSFLAVLVLGLFGGCVPGICSRTECVYITIDSDLGTGRTEQRYDLSADVERNGRGNAHAGGGSERIQPDIDSK